MYRWRTIVTVFTVVALLGVDDGVATDPEDFRFPRGPMATEQGYPLPLTGKPITSTPVVAKTEDDLKQYPQYYIPGKEKLAENEMRITSCGSGNPPMRRGQGSTCWLVELGNGDSFVFDVGGGTVANLWSMMVPPAKLDKLFITHLHLDHVGGFLTFYDAMGWARNNPLNVWGPSGYTEEMGTAAFVENMKKVSHWHVESKRGIIPQNGSEIIAHEFDASLFSKDNPRQLVYDENGVQIYAFPVVHLLFGAMGYRLEWNGLSMAFTGDSEPSLQEAEQAKDVDVFIHEAFISPEAFAEKNNMPIKMARDIVYKAHTPPDMLGRVYTLAKPNLGVATHYFLDDDLIDVFFESIQTSYGGPVVLSQDLMVINVTPEQIVTRMAVTDMLYWAPPPPEGGAEPVLAPPSEAKVPDWLLETKITK
jgi:ribonuclease Z